MFIIVDKSINKIKQTIDKNYGMKTNENELLQEVNSNFIEKFNTAQDYTLIFADGKVTDIKILKTWDEYKEEEQLNPRVIEEKVDVEKVTMASAIVDLNNRIVELENKLLEKEGN